MEKLVAQTDGLLKKEDFMKDGEYSIPPQIHDVLIPLLANIYCTGTKNNKYREAKRIKTRQNLVEDLHNKMSEDQFEKLNNTPVFKEIELEVRLEELIKKEMGILLGSMYYVDHTIRYMYLFDLYARLLEIRRELRGWNREVELIKENLYGVEGQKSKIEKESVRDPLFDKDDLLLKTLNSYIRDTLDGKEFCYDDERYDLPESYEIIAGIIFKTRNLPSLTELREHFMGISPQVYDNQFCRMIINTMNNAFKGLQETGILPPHLLKVLNRSVYQITIVELFSLIDIKGEEDYTKEAYRLIEKKLMLSNADNQKEIMEFLEGDKTPEQIEKDIARFRSKRGWESPIMTPMAELFPEIF